MKLVRFGESGNERPGVLIVDGARRMILDVRSMAFDIEDYNEHFFASGGLSRLRNLLRESNPKLVPAEGIRLGPPIARPSKIICLGKNYAAHAKEFDSAVPASPILFSKATSAITGPWDPVVLPRDSAGIIDGEVELAVVIGCRAKHVAEPEALGCVAGYMILNDITDREAQRIGQQWFRGKSPDTFCPMGPWLVTADEVGDPHRLDMRFMHNGVLLQQDTTASMIFKIPFLISFITASITLLPGDVIATGTPAGIGTARRPPLVFRAGDRIEIEICKLGRQENEIRAE